MAKVSNGVNARVRGAVRRPLAAYGAVGGYAARGVGRGVGGSAARALNTGAETRRRQLNNLNANLSQKGWIGKATARTLDRTAGAGFDRLAGAQVLGSETAKQRRERIDKQQKGFNDQAAVIARNNDATQELANARKNKDINDPTQREERRKAINALGGKVAKMSDAEILNQDKDILKDPAIAQHLTDGHIKALKESGMYDNATMKEITDSRNTASIDTLSETLDSNNATAKELNDTLDQLAQTIQRMPTERVQDLGIDRLKSHRVASNLSTKQIEDLENSGRYTASEIQEIKESKKAATIAIANGSAPKLTNSTNGEQAVALSDRRERFFKSSAQDAGKLPAELFSNPIMAQYITPAALQQRVRNGLSSTEVKRIEDNINQHISSTDDIKLRAMWSKWSNNTTEGARFNII